jgi:hypothetical protein
LFQDIYNTTKTYLMILIAHLKANLTKKPVEGFITQAREWVTGAKPLAALLHDTKCLTIKQSA